MLSLPWWSWAVAAAVIGMAELHAPGSYLIWVAIGAAVTAVITASTNAEIPSQVSVFTVACLLSCAAGYFVYRRINNPVDIEVPLNQRTVSMIGRKGVVCASLLNGRGKVRLDDTVWLAEGPDLIEGAAVIVKAVRGTSVIVEPV